MRVITPLHDTKTSKTPPADCIARPTKLCRQVAKRPQLRRNEVQRMLRVTRLVHHLRAADRAAPRAVLHCERLTDLLVQATAACVDVRLCRCTTSTIDCPRRITTQEQDEPQGRGRTGRAKGAGCAEAWQHTVSLSREQRTNAVQRPSLGLLDGLVGRHDNLADIADTAAASRLQPTSH